MNLMFLVIGLVVLLIVVILIPTSLGSKKNKKNSENINNSEIKINDLILPRKIEQMNPYSLFQACKIITDSYVALNYVNKLASALDKIEWHSWQISILIQFLKVHKDFILPYDIKIINSMILNLSNDLKEKEMQKIFKKYINHVNIEKNRDELSREIIWTAREVSVILFNILKNQKG
ncbi:hypothetical protein [Arcobacter caeni]|uniref:Uncharacterized protein n=1 Tax=Arcobacter caeni TaxID=1912877 RepID=A0A363D5Y3_9BACT|nr:hypothetical protein [Arcobacter caeni]PUE66702.1 hypothetical protein B0174_01220 [Arcobacter caeni]